MKPGLLPFLHLCPVGKARPGHPWKAAPEMTPDRPWPCQDSVAPGDDWMPPAWDLPHWGPLFPKTLPMASKELYPPKRREALSTDTPA